MDNKIVLAYSGGLDTTVALHYLSHKYKYPVFAYCADVGQRDNSTEIKQRAMRSGATEILFDDIKEKFITDFVFLALKANAVYEKNYLLGTPLARPAIVEGMIKYAHQKGANILSHGCTPKGNDQVRFELSAVLLDNSLELLAPWREWDLKSREDLVVYCKNNDLPIDFLEKNLFSHDENLVHITTEGDYLEYTENAFKWQDLKWIMSKEKVQDKEEEISISFYKGVPVAINNAELSPMEIILKLNEIGARNGVGFQDIIENRINGIKVRGVFENPALMILHSAHMKLECLTLNSEVQKIKDMLTPIYSDIVYKGLWFSEERKLIQTLIDESQKYVTGDVTVVLYKGSVFPSAVKSQYSLYNKDLATLHKGMEFDSRDATGFIRTLSLRYHIEQNIQIKQKELF